MDIKIEIRTATQTRKQKLSTYKKLSFIEDNINKFKNNKIPRLDFVKIMAFKHHHIQKFKHSTKKNPFFLNKKIYKINTLLKIV